MSIDDRVTREAGTPRVERYWLDPETATHPSPRGSFPAEAIRRDFPILRQRVRGRPLIWLDNAATSQKPQPVIDALVRYYTEYNSNVHRGAHTLAARATEAYEDARRAVQRFLGAATCEEVVFTRGTTEAINLVAQTLGRTLVHSGDEIVLTALEHHSNIVPWQLLATEKNATIKVAPLDDNGDIALEEYARLLGPRTRIVALSHVSNVLGTVLPVRTMTELAHAWEATVVVDGAQAAPRLPIDVRQLDADFYTLSGHKMLGPTGIGALYGRRDLLEQMPPWQGGGSMIDRVDFTGTTYARPPSKFEAGTGNIAAAIGLEAAIDYLNSIDHAAASQHEKDLVAYTVELLQQIPGIHVLGAPRQRLGAVSFVVDGAEPKSVGAALDRVGIAVRAGHHCAQPVLRSYGLESSVRASPALYNTYTDIDALANTLRHLDRRPITTLSPPGRRK